MACGHYCNGVHSNSVCCEWWLLQGVFREENFNTAMTILNDTTSIKGDEQRKRRSGGPLGKLSLMLPLLIAVYSNNNDTCIVCFCYAPAT